MSDHDFETLASVAVDSVLWRGATRVSRTAQAAWLDSRTGAMMKALGARARALRPAHRVRALSLVLAWTGIVHLACLSMVPAYVAPGTPRGWVVAGIIGAAVIAGAAGPVANAWDGSRLARVFRTRS